MEDDRRLKSILDAKVVAVVGVSRDPSKDSHRVAAYLKAHEYHVLPINPSDEKILGEKSYGSLSEIPDELQRKIEVVDIFRPSGKVQPIVDQAIQLKQKHGGLKAIWMQLGIINDVAAEKARNAGIEVVMNRCMMVEHRRLMGK